jgi:hypothetical protein
MMSNGRSSVMPGPYPVRKPAALSTTAVTGDGKGSENPVPVGGFNQVVLLVDVNPGGTVRDIDVYMEISINGTDYYRETVQSSISAGLATMNKKTYRLPQADFTINVDHRMAISMDVLSAWARFTFAASGNTTNVACRAITGRV